MVLHLALLTLRSDEYFYTGVTDHGYQKNHHPQKDRRETGYRH